MKNILDQDYEVIQISEKGSGILSVNQPVWQEELYRLERISNAWLMAAIFLLFVMVSFSFTSNSILLLGLFLYIVYNRIGYRARYKNLVMHGLYNYEVYDTKVVRYTDVDYLRFELEDVKTIKIKKYGIVLYTKRGILSHFLNHERKELLVIPNKIKGYSDIESFFVELKKRK